jgi:hypothetical protein
MREVYGLPKDTAGYVSVGLISDGVHLLAEFEYFSEGSYHIGGVEFTKVRRFTSYGFKAFSNLAPPKADVIYEVGEPNSGVFKIWFYEDIILEVECSGFRIRDSITGSLASEFSEWRVPRSPLGPLEENTAEAN